MALTARGSLVPALIRSSSRDLKLICHHLAGKRELFLTRSQNPFCDSKVITYMAVSGDCDRDLGQKVSILPPRTRASLQLVSGPPPSSCLCAGCCVCPHKEACAPRPTPSHTHTRTAWGLMQRVALKFCRKCNYLGILKKMPVPGSVLQTF